MGRNPAAPWRRGTADGEAVAVASAPLSLVGRESPSVTLPRRPARLIAARVRLARSASLACADALALLVAVALVSAFAPAQGMAPAGWVGIAAVWLGAGTALHLHRGGGLAASIANELPELFAFSLGAVVAGAFVGASLSRPFAVELVLALLWVSCAGRVGVLAAWRRFGPRERLLLIGGDELRARIARKLELEPRITAQLVAQVGDDQTLGALGSDELAEVVRATIVELGCERVVVSGDELDAAQLRAVTEAAIATGANVSLLPTIGGAIGSRARLGQLAELPMLEYHCRPISPTAEALKRAFDLVLGVAAVVAAAPLFAAIAIAIKLDDGGPVFFRQLRGGRGASPFAMLKFRTLHPDADDELGKLIAAEPSAEPMYKLARDDHRVTRVGRYLRRTSLDELPQLINVLRGEMSLVGPRPEDLRLVRRYDAEALAIRCGMRPGMTGPMQVHGRAELGFRERLELEREYIENYSLARDIWILALTASEVLGGRGAY